jgi:heme A synthase
MATKRSIGVSIFGWWYAIAGAIGILSFPILLMVRIASSFFPQNNMLYMRQFTGNFYMAYALVMSVVALVTGIGLLKLKPWARRLIIIICVVAIAYSVFVSGDMIMHSSQFVEMSMSSNPLPKDTSAETIAAIKSFTQGIMVVSATAGIIFNAGLLAFVVWFFMRKSVREQFEPGTNSAPAQLK